jgi:hypothetical protein
MRFVLAFLAALALATSPVATVAAQVACSQSMSGAQAGMAMPSIDHLGDKTSVADPCCDHADRHGKKSDTSCAQACATTCGVAVALPSPLDGVAFAPARAAVPLARLVSLHPYEPPGLERPPKSMV